MLLNKITTKNTNYLIQPRFMCK